MTAFGNRPFGSESLFGGPGALTILGVAALGTHEVLVDFDIVPETFDPAGFNSATNPRNWVVTPVDPRVESTTPGVFYNPNNLPVASRSPLVIGVDYDSAFPTQVVVAVDSAFERLVEYDLEVQPLVEGDHCEGLSGVTTWRFMGVGAGPPLRPRFVQLDRYRDWALEFFPKDPDQPEGTWTLNSSGDIALHDGEASLRKRVYRRILTQLNGFSHLVGYGADLRIKSMLRAPELQRLANSLQEQIRLEPDVRFASCSARQLEQGDGGFVEITVNVVRDDSREARLVYGIPQG